MTKGIFRFTQHLGAVVAAALTLGLVQAARGTLSVCFLYRDMVLAPYAFLSLEADDAFAKIYSMVNGPLGLPAVLSGWEGQWTTHSASRPARQA